MGLKLDKRDRLSKQHHNGQHGLDAGPAISPPDNTINSKNHRKSGEQTSDTEGKSSR